MLTWICWFIGLMSRVENQFSNALSTLSSIIEIHAGVTV